MQPNIWKYFHFPKIFSLKNILHSNKHNLKVWGTWKSITSPYLPSLFPFFSLLFSSLPPFPNSVSFSRWSWSLFCWINSQAYLSGFSQKKKKRGGMNSKGDMGSNFHQNQSWWMFTAFLGQVARWNVIDVIYVNVSNFLINKRNKKNHKWCHIA